MDSAQASSLIQYIARISTSLQQIADSLKKIEAKMK